MIKKILGLGIFLLLFVSSGTFGYQYTGNNNNGGGYTYLVLDNNESGNFDGTWVNRGTENLVEFTNNGNGNWNFMYNADNYTNIWRLNSNNAGYYYGLQTYYFFSDNKLYFHKAGLANGVTVEVNNFKLFEGTGGLADYNNFTDNNSGYTYSLSDVVSEIGNVDNIIYGVYTYDRQGVFTYSRDIICFGSNNFYYCSSCVASDYNTNPFCLGGNSPIVDLGLNVNSTILDISSLVSDSPFVGGGDGSSGTLIPTNSDVDKVINYYETRFNWNEDMCYVGTNDLTSVYGTSGVDFNSGTGDTIFGLYYSLYNSYGSSIINNVGKFVNVWLLNYSQWFYEDTPKWIGVDNGPDTNVSYIYTGFTFPFANKSVAIYFMASNLYDGYSRESSQGVDMAFYCYSKLNYDNINDGTINYEEVKEQVSENILGRIDTYVNYHINPNTNNSQYQVPTSGSFWDSFGTGYEDTDIELDTTFSDFYTRITNIFQNYTPQYSTGIIPDYILYALIFLILFRIMKH